jgi:ATP-dependent Lon protease
MFICTANYIEQIPPELLDRLEIIELSSYTEYEKLNIAKDYLIRESLIEHDFKENQVVFTDDAILNIIRHYTKEAGVRELKRNIDTIIRKIVKDVVITKKEKRNYIIEEKNIISYLGQIKYDYNANKEEYVGVVNAMSYTPFGGDILQIETAIYKGKNNIITTGSLGDVFKESIEIALSYIKNNYRLLKVNFSKLEDIDIHIHVPEGAVKKDGPSAGVAITTALISNLTNKKIPTDISMTGEITLNGKVLAIGGLKEKIIGAKRSNIKTIYLPKDNKNDLDEIDEYIKEGINFVLVDNYFEIYKDLFGGNDEK